MKRLFGALAALLVACAAHAAKGKPDWVSGPSAKYPREAYLVGVGLGDDRQTSEDRARGEISKIFSTLVSVQTDLTESETNLKQGKTDTSTFQQSISQNVQTVSKKVLEGVEVVENWQDEAVRQHYALAVLSRSKAAAAVTEKILDFNGQAEAWKKQMDEAQEKLPKVKAAMKLLALLNARKGLVDDLRVLRPGDKAPEPGFAEAEVRPAAAKAVAELDVVVDMSGGRSDQVETGIVKGLSALGFQAKPGSAQDASDIFVEGKVDTQEQEGDDKRWKWARSTVTLALKDGKTGKVFLQFDASDRQASRNYREALRRSHVELAKKVASQVHEAVTAHFENQ